MSNRYKGGIISATPPTTTGGESGTASGAWTLEQQMQAQAAGLWPLQPTGPYIEEVFSTWIATSPQRVVNGLDFSGKGGLVWGKQRNGAGSHTLVDTVRGGSNFLQSNSTSRQINEPTIIPTFYNDGFETGSYVDSGNSFVYWGFREAPKFFDVVTWTGDGTTPRSIAHNLGSTAACVMVKRTDTNGNWKVLFTGLTRLCLNSTEAEMGTFTVQGGYIDNANASTFTLVSNAGSVAEVNASGGTYVAYIFASNAGGFGLTGTDNVISCGSFTAAGGGATVNLGYEPQWVLYKRTDATDDWKLTDSMRGMYAQTTADAPILYPNLSSAEATPDGLAPFVSATGFFFNGVQNFPGSDNGTYIYIAIRRGPMRTPTTGTSVFSPNLYTEIVPTGTELTAPFPTDLNLVARRNSAQGFYWLDRLRGSTTSNNALLTSFNTSAEFNFGVTTYDFANNTGVKVNFLFNNTAASTVVDYQFRRAPGFFDEVCYTGTGTNQFINHNLGVRPDLYIVKRRSATASWAVTVNGVSGDSVGLLNSSNAFGGAAYDNGYLVNGTVPASNFGAGFGSINNDAANASGSTYVAYLFASAPGVSKVGSYTGTGTTQTINCGFTGGARFVLIKRTDSTGDWYVWDTARGMIPANDPYLLLNSTAAEVTNTDFVDTAATGFEITSTAPAAINASGGTFIFLAIA